MRACQIPVAMVGYFVRSGSATCAYVMWMTEPAPETDSPLQNFKCDLVPAAQTLVSKRNSWFPCIASWWTGRDHVVQRIQKTRHYHHVVLVCLAKKIGIRFHISELRPPRQKGVVIVYTLVLPALDMPDHSCTNLVVDQSRLSLRNF